MSDEMKRELAGLKADVGGLKADVGGLKADMGGLKADVGGLKTENRRMMAVLARLEEKLDLMATKAEVKDLFDAMMTRMDGFSKVLEDSRFRWTVHADTLLDHDRRLKRLEAR